MLPQKICSKSTKGEKLRSENFSFKWEEWENVSEEISSGKNGKM